MLESERLLFRKYAPSDFHFLESMLTNPEVVRFIGNGETKTKTEAVKFMEWIFSTYQQEAGTGLMLAVSKADGRFIGHVGLVPQNIEGSPEIEVGYWIAREHWGNGFATEAASAFVNYGINVLGLRRLVSLIQPANTASIGVAKKIGMRFERELIYKSRHVSLYSFDK
jgi:RimJ/RimL family protein N-acetyltransferase